VYESLRLYPPVRRMRVSQKAKHLQAFRTGGISDVDRTIDAEAILRDPKYWGSSAGEWKPSRFLRADGEIDSSILTPSRGWIPFAAGGMKCPSAGGYSVRLTAVVAGEVLRLLFPRHDQLQWHLEGPQWDLSSASGLLLRPGRDEYTHVDVVTRSNKLQAADI
jgi:cytochrome P450